MVFYLFLNDNKKVTGGDKHSPENPPDDNADKYEELFQAQGDLMIDEYDYNDDGALDSQELYKYHADVSSLAVSHASKKKAAREEAAATAAAAPLEAAASEAAPLEAAAPSEAEAAAAKAEAEAAKAAEAAAAKAAEAEAAAAEEAATEITGGNGFDAYDIDDSYSYLN
jgi:hypothetical protein